MLRCQHVLKAVGAGSQVGLSLFGNVRRMVVQNDPYGAVGWIVFCAEQRVNREGSSPSSARMRGAVSKSGSKASLAGESGRYDDV
jgi:hypothetical protein